MPPGGEGDAGATPRGDRRRVERRINARVADLTLPELRRMLVTTMLFVVVAALFLWMVRSVIVAGVLGAVIGLYLRPAYLRVLARLRSPTAAATVTLVVIIVPLLLIALYSYAEIQSLLRYLTTHQDEVARRITDAVRPLPLIGGPDTAPRTQRWVAEAAAYGTRLPGELRRALLGFSIATTIFLSTAFYILTDLPRISAAIRERIPPRYDALVDQLRRHFDGVLYGTIYATVLTQALKAAVLFVLNVIFGVPLAAALAVLSFVIGFFPIVGSWSVYVPVALWLYVFRGAPLAALLMLAAGFLVNTVFISTYLRPKLAAERSRVLNFFWMFVGLVTGVYAFGLPGIILGPMLIGLLKAIVDTAAAPASWPAPPEERDADEAQASGAMG